MGHDGYKRGCDHAQGHLAQHHKHGSPEEVGFTFGYPDPDSDCDANGNHDADDDTHNSS